MIHLDDTWQRIYEAKQAAGIDVDWTVAERDQMEALADDMNGELLTYPVIHAYPTKDRSQLEFWCRYCKTHHIHGRHLSHHGLKADDGRSDSPMPLDRWLTYLQQFFNCTFNDNAVRNRGVCTCPAGSGDGHRVAHCQDTSSPIWDHGYVLHEVEADDPRAQTRPERGQRR
ncbi:hypothetical protein AB431_20770 [Mycobacterium sp. EPa45]|nr:hypothetical protein AB431_20770 [Mycobacterium sp. EPa45]